MMADDKSHLLPLFWEQMTDLDWSRKESLVEIVPELNEICKYLESIGYNPPPKNFPIILQ
jgi:hypothetical protein